MIGCCAESPRRDDDSARSCHSPLCSLSPCSQTHKDAVPRTAISCQSVPRPPRSPSPRSGLTPCPRPAAAPLRSSAAFSTSAARSRVIATNPVKAKEVPVSRLLFPRAGPAVATRDEIVGVGVPRRRSRQLLTIDAATRHPERDRARARVSASTWELTPAHRRPPSRESTPSSSTSMTLSSCECIHPG